jgi:hypothetical protein
MVRAMPRPVVVNHHLRPRRPARGDDSSFVDATLMLLRIRAHDLNLERRDVRSPGDITPRVARQWPRVYRVGNNDTPHRQVVFGDRPCDPVSGIVNRDNRDAGFADGLFNGIDAHVGRTQRARQFARHRTLANAWQAGKGNEHATTVLQRPLSLDRNRWFSGAGAQGAGTGGDATSARRRHTRNATTGRRDRAGELDTLLEALRGHQGRPHDLRYQLRPRTQARQRVTSAGSASRHRAQLPDALLDIVGLLPLALNRGLLQAPPGLVGRQQRPDAIR